MLFCETKIVDLQDATSWCEAWHRRELVVGFSNGCFDVLHIGHLSSLEWSMGKCDRLVVAVNGDESVRRLKGRNRPINTAYDRARIVAALAVVDCVIVFEEDTPLALIKTLNPDVLFKGADYQVRDIVGAEYVLSRGGNVHRAPLVPGKSTSRIAEKMAS